MGLHWLLATSAALAVTGAIGLLWSRSRKCKQPLSKPRATRRQHTTYGRSRQSGSSSGKGKAAGASTSSSNKDAKGKRKRRSRQPLGCPADPLIPQHELHVLQDLLQQVYSWRGWQGGPYHIVQAWHEVLAAATSQQGGSWPQQFTGSHLTGPNCDALLHLIDEQFFGGKMLGRLARAQQHSQQQQSRPEVTNSSGSGGDAGAGAAAAAAAAAAITDSSGSSCGGGSNAGNTSSSTVLQGDTGSGSLQGMVAAAMAAQGNVAPASSSATNSSSTGSNRHTCGATHLSNGNAATCQPQPPLSACQAADWLHCQVVQCYDGRWLAYFDTQDNIIYINCWRWAKPVSPAEPWNCEGVVCTNRLQMLVHTLAHELVHAIVFHLFPDIDAHSAAYTANERHGPIFHLLNKQLFGHTSDALEDVRLLPASCHA